MAENKSPKVSEKMVSQKGTSSTESPSGTPHPFHLVDPSPWPILAALTAFVLAIGAVMWAHGLGLWVLLGGTALVGIIAFAWWRDVVKEALSGAHSLRAKQGFRYGIALFILSEAAFFFAFFWTYFYVALFPSGAIGGVWPPKGIKTFDPFDIPLLNTLVLLLSGSLITWAHEHLLNGDIKNAAWMTGLTVLLGLLFTALQAFEYIHAPFSLDQNVFTSIFYIATGFHGFHVIVGTIFLGVCFFRLRKGHFTATDHFGFEAAAWYWHFVDVVWLFLFVSIYLWGAGPQ